METAEQNLVSTTRHVVRDPLVRIAFIVSLVIALLSVVYYNMSTKAPSVDALSNQQSSEKALTATGTVTSSQNPDLSFAGSGRVAHVYVHVGDSVKKGQVLSTLDLGTLLASRAQASANAAAAEARLSEMKAGPRDVDLATKQVQVTQAETTLENSYGSAVTHIQQAYGKTTSGLSQYTDTLFNQPNTSVPTVAFNSSDNLASNRAVDARVQLLTVFPQWQNDIAGLVPTSDPANVEKALIASIDHLQKVRIYNEALAGVLSSALTSSTFTQAMLTTAQTNVAGYRDSVYAAITQLQNDQQQIATQKVAIQSAKESLRQADAGSTAEQIAAQEAAVRAAWAAVQNVNAQIGNNSITAPFTGTVASVRVKEGDSIMSGSPAMSLQAAGKLQVDAFFSELDITRIHVGDDASVTLDAYGSGAPFTATVVSVDKAPSNAQGGYRVTLQFNDADARIVTGMTANITISVQ